jgi:hypothetical protein
LYRRSVCSLHVGKRDLAQQDLQRHLAFGPSPYMEEIQQQMAGYRLSIP